MSKTGPFPGSGYSSSLMYHWSQRTEVPFAFSGCLPRVIIAPALVSCHFPSRTPVSKWYKAQGKETRADVRIDCFCDFSFTSARKRIGWEMLGHVLGMDLLMVSAKCAFGTCVIWSTGCFEAFWKHPCTLCREVTARIQGWAVYSLRKWEKPNAQVPDLSPFSVFFVWVWVVTLLLCS